MNNAPILSIHEGKAVTTSQNLAQTFGKRHTEVMRVIRTLDCPAEFRRRNFASAEYKDAQGKPRPMFEVTRDGFAILAMGFTGKEAMQFKVKYIEAFNRMEAELLKIQHKPAQARLTDWHAVISMMDKAGSSTKSAFTQALYNLGFTPQGDAPEAYRIVPPSILVKLIQLARKGNDWARNLVRKTQDIDVGQIQGAV